MPLNPVLLKPFAAALRGLGFGLLVCLLSIPAYAQDTTNIANAITDGAADRNLAALNAGNGSNDTSTQSALTTIVNGTNPLANQSLCAAFDEARQKAQTIQLSRDNAYFQYQVAGAFAANCVGKLIDYANFLSDGVGQVISAASAANGDPVVTAVTVIAQRILSNILRQLIANLENQICSITTQLTSAMESVVQNAICIPSGALNSNLFNFNLNLNLPNLQCDGIAINPLQVTEIDPATGQPYAMAESTYAAGMLSNSGSVGGYSADDGGPPLRGNWLSGTSAAISGDPDPLSVAGDGSAVGTVGTVTGSADYQCFDMAKAIQYALANATDGYQGSPPNGNCAVGVRMALCAGGMDQFCVGGHGNAKDYGSSLLAAGYVLVGDQNSANLSLQPGCILIDAATSSHPYGHIQMFAGGNTWVSDFTTTNMYGGSSYARNPNFKLYCPSPKLNQNSNGSCR